MIGLGFRPLVFTLLNHIIDCPFRSQHRLDTSRRATVDCRLQNGLPNLDFCEAVVDCTASVQCQFHPSFLGNDYANVYHVGQALVSTPYPRLSSWTVRNNSKPCMGRCVPKPWYRGEKYPWDFTYSKDCVASSLTLGASRYCPRRTG